MLDKLYDDIGGKIKGWAKWIFVIEAISIVIAAFVLILNDHDNISLGLIMIVFGPWVALVSTWLLYGFGELIERVTSIDKKLPVCHHSPLVEKNDVDVTDLTFSEVPEDTQNSDLILQQIEPSEPWTCIICGKVNQAADKYCPECNCSQDNCI